jgi:hypothetical protein
MGVNEAETSQAKDARSRTGEIGDSESLLVSNDDGFNRPSPANENA